MILAILQARMSSTRLLGKVLKPLAGTPALAKQVERVSRARRIEKLVVATSTEPEDDAISDLCRRLDVGCFRGALHDVLDRYYQAARREQPAHVVRLTGDCPLTDWRLIDAVVEHHLAHGFDYTSNALERTFPIGLDAEAMTFRALETAWLEAEAPDEREHVTPFLYRHPERFRLGRLTQVEDLSRLRWTLDTPADLALIERVYAALYDRNPDFGTGDILEFLLDHPDIRGLNADPEATKVYERLAAERASRA